MNNNFIIFISDSDYDKYIFKDHFSKIVMRKKQTKFNILNYFLRVLISKFSVFLKNKYFLEIWLKLVLPTPKKNRKLNIVVQSNWINIFSNKKINIILSRMYEQYSVTLLLRDLIYLKSNNPTRFVNQLKDYFHIIVTYDSQEAKKYNLNHFPMIYRDVNFSRNKNYYDLIFVGKNKNRVHKLHRIYEYAQRHNLKSYFLINGVQIEDRIHKGIFYNKKISYKKYINIMKKTSVIIDIKQNKSTGLSLRHAEALFFGKRIITDNETIMKYDFYDERFIKFIKNDFKNLHKFIKSESFPNNSSFKKRYTVESLLDYVNDILLNNSVKQQL